MASVTQKDVALAASVSQALVSLVLSEKTGGSASSKTLRVSPETRQKILEAAERLGYRRKALSRPARMEKSFLYLGRLRSEEAAGTWMNQADETRHRALQNAVIEEAARNGFAVTVRLYHQAQEVVSLAVEATVDGIILGGAEPVLLEAFSAKVPVVTLNEQSSSGDVVVADHQSVLEQALDFLSRRGHRRIALLAAHPNADVVALRRAAFEELSERLGLVPDPFYENCHEAGDFLDRFLHPSQSAERRPTAVLADEFLALSLQNQAVREGLSLPQDLSLVGLGRSLASEIRLPSLTTVDVVPAEIARATLSLMTERLKTRGGVFASRRIQVAATLRDGDSVAMVDEVPNSRAPSPRLS